MNDEVQELSVSKQAALVEALAPYIVGRVFSDSDFRIDKEYRMPKPPPGLLAGIKRMVHAGFKNNMTGRDFLQQTIIRTISKEIVSHCEWAGKISSTNLDTLENYAEEFYWTLGSMNSKQSAINIYRGCAQLGLSDGDAVFVCLTIASKIWPYTSFQPLSGEISREIQFAPEHQQASIGILSYFSVILKEKLPDANATVTIRQEKDRVVLVINYDDGTREEISQLLTDYGLVVIGKKPASELLSNDHQIMALNHKLQMAEMELRLARDMHGLELRAVERDLGNRNLTIEYLKSELSRQLRDNSQLVAGIINSLPNINATKIEKSTRSLIAELVDAIQERDVSSLRKTAEIISLADPGFFIKLKDFVLSSAMGGVVGNTAHAWVLNNWPTIIAAANAIKF